MVTVRNIFKETQNILTTTNNYDSCMTFGAQIQDMNFHTSQLHCTIWYCDLRLWAHIRYPLIRFPDFQCKLWDPQHIANVWKPIEYWAGNKCNIGKLLIRTTCMQSLRCSYDVQLNSRAQTLNPTDRQSVCVLVWHNTVVLCHPSQRQRGWQHNLFSLWHMKLHKHLKNVLAQTQQQVKLARFVTPALTVNMFLTPTHNLPDIM